MMETLSRRLGGWVLVTELTASAPGGPSIFLAQREGGTAGSQVPPKELRLFSTLFDNEKAVSAFVEAARKCVALRHANLAAVHEVGRADGSLFVVTEHVAGETLAAVTRALKSAGTPLGPRLAAHVAAEVCAGLEAGHQKGIVHERLSPEHIAIGYDGSVKALALGLATAEERLRAAPFERPPGDARADVRALGGILAGLVAGVEVLHASLAITLERAQADDPKKRFPSAMALRQKLLEYLRETATGVAPAKELEALMQRCFPEEVERRRAVATRGSDPALVARRSEPAGPAATPGPAPLSVPRLIPPPPPKSAPRVVPPPPASRSAALPSGPPEPPVKSAGPRVVGSIPPAAHISPPPEESVIVDAPIAIEAAAAVTAKPGPAKLSHNTPTYQLRPEEARAVLARTAAPRRSWVPFAVLGGVLVPLALAFAMVFRARTQPVETPAPLVTAPTPLASLPATDPVPAPTVPPAVSSAPAASSVPAVSSAVAVGATPAATETAIQIETVPPNAQISIGGTKKGVSPLTLRLPKSNEEVSIEIKRAGYQTLRERVVPDVDQRLKLTLARAANAHSSATPYHKFE